MSRLKDLIQNINSLPLTVDKGTQFEILCLYFFRHDKFYKSLFSDSWLWNDWPEHNTHDTGIDIVAKLRDSDSYCAIQCKFRDENVTINKPEIDSFLAASSKKIFSQRIIISTYDNFNANAEDALKNQSPSVKRLALTDLENSAIDWSNYNPENPGQVLYVQKKIRPHQQEAINAIIHGFETHDRGKLIMACGTGKTFTSLKAAERLTGSGGVVLVLVPSISLLNQTLLAWHDDSDLELLSFAVCSDITAGRKNDDEDITPSDLSLPPTTDAQKLITAWKNISDERRKNSLTVIFSTYQSLQVVKEAQELLFPDFDLIICDEAHRTAGINEGKFKQVHDNNYVKAQKRLYMTATPKIFTENLKAKAVDKNMTLYSMDDENVFGTEFYNLSFSNAVDKDLLSDYKVMIFMIDADSEGYIPITPEKNILISEAAKIKGCLNALSKNMNPDHYEFMKYDPEPMRTAVAFTRTIADSKNFAEDFVPVIENYSADDNPNPDFYCEVQHVDGSFSASKRDIKISWLKNNNNHNSCRILSNARCLSEGVDVPALDAVIFFNSKKSQVDIVQSVGRVMRKSQGKKFGYVIIPIAVRSDVSPEEALNNNSDYKAVWDVLRALRSHDDKFNAIINQLDLNKRSPKIIIVPPKHNDESTQITLKFLADWEKALSAAIVKNCGDREYWDKWVKNLSDVAEVHSSSLNALINSEIKQVNSAFDLFLNGLRQNANPRISQDEAVNMLSQHMISRPVFNALFNDFSQLNPVSMNMQEILTTLEKYDINDQPEELKNFYSYVNNVVSEAKTGDARQGVIKRIYENFFKLALPKLSAKLGIVYTPLEIVDFIIRSCDWAVRHELELENGLADDSIHILDPFTGTGTFIVRLIQLGIIPPEILKEKYRSGKIMANEILLLAYYIAAINIESAFFEVNDENYEPFPGIVLTDTFELNKPGDKTIKHSHFMFMENGRRAAEEEKSSINVIIGNPPYSVGQRNANDNNQNARYIELDAAIRQSYAALSTATNINSLYDSYIRAIKWASERVYDNGGVVCFVTNGSFIDSNSADGMRKCLAKDFTGIYVFNLRGNQRGGDWKKEGEKVFGEGSQLPVTITLFVRNVKKLNDKGKIFYYQVDDYMTRTEKLFEVKARESFGKMIEAGLMREIIPNRYGDWINQRGDEFENFYNLGNKKEKRPAIWGECYSAGVKTNRDAWCYNFSRESLKANMQAMIDTYNYERERWKNYHGEKKLLDFVNNDKTKISWGRDLFEQVERDKIIQFREEAITESIYRPFAKEYFYFDANVNDMIYKVPAMFPTSDAKNRVICIPGIGSKKNFSVLMTNCIPSLSIQDASQCFPLYWYAPEQRYAPNAAKFQEHYNDESITPEDVFYYVYGVLSSPEYSQRFGDDTKKVLARVPFVESVGKFQAFSRAGRKLGELHVNYESVEPWPLRIDGGIFQEDLRVKKMKADKKAGIIYYNEAITIREIPSEAWNYIVNGRSALEWIIERYQDSTDKDSKLRNDCNEWGREHENARYILDLIARVTRVSVETIKILNGLPELGV